MPKKLPSGLSGIAGEYFVAAELTMRGLAASLTLRNTRGLDIIVADPKGFKAVSVQVKTDQYSSKRWPLNKKAETEFSDDLFYVFVRLNRSNPNRSPSYHIIPSHVVATYCQETHERWLREPGRNGQQRKDNPVRVFRDLDDRYLGRWDLIELRLRERT